jgi:hypothetical protein
MPQVTITVDQHDLERVTSITPDLYLPATREVLRQASVYATREAQAGARRDVGAIANTISAVVHSPMDVSVRSNHPGALAAEFGRHAGTPPPPPSTLRSWAARHGMGGLEFVVAQAISQRGIRGRFFLRKAEQKLEQTEMPRLLNKAADEVERKWAS